MLVLQCELLPTCKAQWLLCVAPAINVLPTQCRLFRVIVAIRATVFLNRTNRFVFVMETHCFCTPRLEAEFLCTVLRMNFSQIGRPCYLAYVLFAVNNAELSNHAFLLHAGHAPLDSHSALLYTLAMWLQSYTVHCCLHMETSVVQYMGWQDLWLNLNSMIVPWIGQRTLYIPWIVSVLETECIYIMNVELTVFRD